jgi:hypothetical protein
MKKLSALLILAFLSGCGGDANTGTPDDATAQDPTLPGSSLQCYHDGDVWLCNEQNSCVRDESIEEVVGEEEEGDGLARLRKDGPITIIAECGSSVSYSSVVTITTVSTNTTN